MIFLFLLPGGIGSTWLLNILNNRETAWGDTDLYNNCAYIQCCRSTSDVPCMVAIEKKPPCSASCARCIPGNVVHTSTTTHTLLHHMTRDKAHIQLWEAILCMRLSIVTMNGTWTFEKEYQNTMYNGGEILITGLPLVNCRPRKRLCFLQGSESPAQQLHQLLEHHCKDIMHLSMSTPTTPLTGRGGD